MLIPESLPPAVPEVVPQLASDGYICACQDDAEHQQTRPSAGTPRQTLQSTYHRTRSQNDFIWLFSNLLDHFLYFTSEFSLLENFYLHRVLLHYDMIRGAISGLCTQQAQSKQYSHLCLL